ncbi:LssY C-terminal domain-containing protein [Azospirillum sp. TSO22-1]|uniref:LssY C-terminal domain-containing protein n=1 Tax=Azospirillum sp. TSO22-1 TaxID=716789 RepID=UPI0018EEAD72|nr:LssY C-terminal domain-containing protein [Azospirillum sp. TSO22-1]
MVKLVLAATVVAAALAGCTSTPLPTNIDYKSRAVTRTEGGVRISAAVLSAEESVTVYGVPLAKKSIQPVWIEVENRDDRAYFLLSPGLDPNFFPASEAAEAFTPGDPPDRTLELDRRFWHLAFHNPVPPGATTSGFVLTNLDEGFKFVHLDLVANGRARTFSILTTVPGFRADYRMTQVFGREIYPAEKIVNYTDDAAFRAALVALPCCVTNEAGSKNGDPLNLVVVGGLDDAFPAFARRGWHATEEKWTGSIMKVVTSALSGERYTNAPVSDLYLFGRVQDLALQRARDNIHQRNHLRLWLSPMRYHGKQVWVGQISRDIGSRLTMHSPTFTTHKIDPDVDEARGALMQDMAYSVNLAKLGFVQGVGAAPRSAPRGNLTTDPYHTDGLRGVLVFDRRHTSLARITFFPWQGTDDEAEQVTGRIKQ